MARKKKYEVPEELVPKSREEAAEAIAEIGRQQRERERIQTEMNEELAVVKERYERVAAEPAQRIRELSAGVRAYCEAHRDELTQGGRTRTVALMSGSVKFRQRPPKVSVRGGDAVLGALRRLGLTRFIRVKETVNKEALLAEPDAVAGLKGITISQKEDLVIEPFETKLEEVVA